MPKERSDIGLIGLAVMGQNLALNIADHGFQISVYNRTTEKTDKFVADNPATPGGLVGTKTLEEFVRSLARPRKIVILVQAGKATDAVIDGLVPLLEPGDIVIDGGNALWTDTIRREKALREKKLRFVGSGVSGGEEGARFGPSLMPGGEFEAWLELKPIWEAVAAKVDAKTGRPIPGAAAGKPVSGGVPCTTYIGANGAGHYVKMVHNGVEYGLMQAYAEGYAILAASPLGIDVEAAIGSWQEGSVVRSWLLDLLIRALAETPDLEGIAPVAADSGEGRWTVTEAVANGVSAPVISAALFARFTSQQRDDDKAMKVVSALRHQFGGHAIELAPPKGEQH